MWGGVVCWGDLVGHCRVMGVLWSCCGVLSGVVGVCRGVGWQVVGVLSGFVGGCGGVLWGVAVRCGDIV